MTSRYTTGKSASAALQGLAGCRSERQRLGRLAGHAHRLLIVGLEWHGQLCLQSGARGEEGVAQNAKHPSTKIGAGSERSEAAQGLDERFLHQVFGLALIARQPAGEVVERIEQRHGQLLEFLVTGARWVHSSTYSTV